MCCEQSDHECHIVYKNTIVLLAETETNNHGKIGLAIAMLYDELSEVMEQQNEKVGRQPCDVGAGGKRGWKS